MDGEPHYNGRTGVIHHIDSMGQLHGSWGGLAVNPEIDDIISLGESTDEENEESFEYD